MTSAERISALHERLVLRRPRVVLAICALLVALSGWYAQDFGLDASADSLTLERDEDLDYYRTLRARYGSDDYLIVTFAPRGELFEDATLDQLRALRDELRSLPRVASVVSILDVPLIQSPPSDLRNFAEGVRRLEDTGTDRGLARRELVESALYRDLIISADAGTTALRVNLLRDEEYHELRDRRDRLREKGFLSGLTTEEAESLELVEQLYDAASRRELDEERRAIAAVRAVLDDYRDVASMHLGGVPMIVADSIEFIQHDLVIFGVAVIVFLIVILLVAFRKPRWAFWALMNCLATCVVMLGLLGLTGWRVTIVSSNFVSLLIILCLALTLHITVRYREAHARDPDGDQLTLVREAVRRIFVPCLYTALTTMVAFGSLIVSGIRPVIDFGWMMVIGLGVGLVFSFTLFPAGLMLLEPGKPRSLRDVTAAITGFFARLVYGRARLTISVAVVLVLASVAGILQLTVENRFIDYYKKTTEIYRGMVLIDRRLGGTTPLDVVIDAPVMEAGSAGAGGEYVEDEFEDDEFEDIFADDPPGEAGITATSYWFNSRRIPEIRAIHEYLDSLPETGKVISVATATELLSELDDSVLSDNLLLSIVYKRMPDDVRKALITPYLSPDGDQLRFSVRVYESDITLERNELISRIRGDLVRDFGLDDEQVHLSGMLVLYNNMLQSLFRSQILTLGAVFVAIFGMFLVLFRSLRMAITAIIPNVVSALAVLGLMGWLGIPLDLMTITIAAITVGIAVDNSIHYLHRFRREFARDAKYWAAIQRCHRTIGRAMYYTSVTIMLGFSILALSQFTPTIYFGVLTGVAMLVALLANMTLLPVLIVTFRAGGKERAAPKRSRQPREKAAG